MKRWLARLDTPGMLWFGLFAAVFWGCMLYVFLPVLPADWVMQSPDLTKFYPIGWRTGYLEGILAGRESVTPLTFLTILLPPLVRQELFFMVTCFLAALAVAWYLRTENVSRPAAYGGGLCFAFAGYSFTLFCAGHGGYFAMVAWVLFAFALINRCFQTQSWFYFVALGAVLIWAEASQQDIWMLFMMLIGAYGLWRSLRAWREERSCRFLLRVYPRFALSALVVLLLGGQQIRRTMGDALQTRQGQFSAVAAATAGPAAAAKPPATPEEVRRQERERWIFCTNWSLPPEDILEFAVAGIFGDESFHGPCPYWGRLGRPDGFVAGRMMPNYRQHTVYLGMITVLLGLFGVWCRVAARFARRDPEATGKTNAAGVGAETAPTFPDLPFWAAAGVVCLVLAMGRYTPVYQLVYHLPYMNYVRAPVKFFHLTEVAAACLAGFGLECLLRPAGAATAVRRRFAFLIIVALLALLVGMGWLQANAASVERHITELGLARLAPSLRAYAGENLLRAAGLAVVTLVCLLLALRSAASARARVLCVSLAILAGTMDLAAVARRYVYPFNVGPHHGANAAVRAMQARTGGRPANVMNYLTGGSPEQDWLGTSLVVHNLLNQMPGAEDKALAALFARFREQPLRYWQLTGVRFVLVPRAAAMPLLRQGVLAPVMDFQLGEGTVRSVEPSDSSLLLAEVAAFPALPAIYPAWEGPVAADSQVAALVSTSWTGRVVADLPPPTDPAAAARLPRSVELESMRRMPLALETQGRVTTEGAGLLVFNERFDRNLEARVDGRMVPVVQANGLWAAIALPSGTHQVSLRLRQDWLCNALSLAACLGLAGWGLARMLSPPDRERVEPGRGP
jgi:hypothetical protein